MSVVRRILAVDDSEPSLREIESCLRSDGFELATARSGREAFDLLLVEDFDLIVLDVGMPGMGGIEVCRRLRADPRTAMLPVIFLTDDVGGDAALIAASRFRAVDCLGKPFEPAELVARVRILLRLQSEIGKLEEEKHALTAQLHSRHRDIAILREQIYEHRELRRAESAARRAYLVVDSGGRIVAVDDGIGDLLGGAARSCGELRELPEPWASELGSLGGDQVSRVPPASDRARRGRRGARVCGGSPRDANAEIEISCQDLDGGGRLFEIRDATDVAELDRQIGSRAPIRVSVEQPDGGYRIRGMIGESPSLARVTKLVDRLRNVRSTVLIHGETGTGKELVARALHFDGRHAKRPFIPIHCGAISPELIESELFGYEKGAFTGALTSKQGLFSAADGGTVFLDEIAETSPDLQVKLLRVLQLGEIRPVGATHTKRVDVRIIAATNQELTDLVDEGRFREDLYYRLDVVKIALPPLRDHVEDLPAIAQHLLERFSVLHDRESEVKAISQGALEVLMSHPWPGNVRELENVLDGCTARGCGEVLQVSDLGPRLQESGHAGTAELGRPFASRVRDAGSLRRQRERVDKLALIHALARFDGDKREAARYLGLGRSTFYRKLKQFGVR